MMRQAEVARLIGMTPQRLSFYVKKSEALKPSTFTKEGVALFSASTVSRFVELRLAAAQAEVELYAQAREALKRQKSA